MMPTLGRMVPKRLTVLGFCLAVIAILVFGIPPTIAALSGGHMAFYVLVFVAVVILVVLAVVLGVALFADPMRLQLRDVSGPEYTEYLRFLRQGDSVVGEHPVIDAARRPEITQESGEVSNGKELPAGGVR